MGHPLIHNHGRANVKPSNCFEFGSSSGSKPDAQLGEAYLLEELVRSVVVLSTPQEFSKSVGEFTSRTPLTTPTKPTTWLPDLAAAVGGLATSTSLVTCEDLPIVRNCRWRGLFGCQQLGVPPNNAVDDFRGDSQVDGCHPRQGGTSVVTKASRHKCGTVSWHCRQPDCAD